MLHHPSEPGVAVGVVTVVPGKSEGQVELVIGVEASELDDLVDAGDL